MARARGLRAAVRPRRRQRRQRQGRDLFGAQEITQARVNFTPSWGPVVKINRSVGFNLTRAGTDGGYYFDWALSDVPSSSEFTNLFRQWRLSKMAITFTYRSSDEATPERPAFTMALDPFAATAPAAQNDVFTRQNRTWSPNATRTTLQLVCDCRAMALSASGPGSGATVTNTLAPKGLWYTCDVPGLAYGALLVWIGGWANAADVIQVKQDYMFEFRSPV